MVLSSLAVENALPSLKVYKGQGSSRAFSEKISSVIDELKIASVTPKKLLETAAEIDSNLFMKDKLEDVAVIYEWYDSFLEQGYLDPSDELTSALNKLGDGEFFKDYDVIIDEKTKLENDEEYFPYIILNELELSDTDRILHVIDWEYSKRHLVTKFKITNNNKTYLNVNEGCCVKQFDYFDELLFNGEVVRHYAIEYENVKQFLTELYDSGKQINFEWKRVDKSNIIDLYIDENKHEVEVC
jgi:hypothetical protein